MSFNRIAVFGHRGWASSAIVEALAASGAPIKVLYRPSSNASGLPSNVTTVEVDVEDQQALIKALEDTDIVISLVGQQGVESQHALVQAIPSTSVKLFVPSDLGFELNEQGLRIPVFKVKNDVEKAAKRAGIPTTVVWPGGFVESSLSAPLLGVDYNRNKIVFTADSRRHQMNLSSRNYVAAGYASIFARTPPSQLQNKTIGLSELRPTGQEIFDALEKKYGTPPETFHHTLERVDSEFEKALELGSPLAAIWWYRKVWGVGQHAQMIGTDIWEVEGYNKATLEELFVEGKMEPYKDLPPQVIGALQSTF